MDNSTANLYWVKAKRETRSKAPIATFSQDGFQKWANTYGVAREEGFTNEDFQMEEPRVQRKPNTEMKLERTPPKVELKAFDQELKPAAQKATGGYGLHDHSRFETEDLGSQMRVFINPQGPEHFSNESPDAMKAIVKKAKKVYAEDKPKVKGGKSNASKKDVGPVPLLIKNPRLKTEGTAIFSSMQDITDLTPDATNIYKEKIYKKRPGKTIDLVKEARAEQKSLLGGKAAKSALKEEEKKPLKDDLADVGGGMEEKEVGGAKPVKKPHASKGKKSARGALVSKLMKTKGLTLGEASRFIKDHKLM